MRHGQGAGVDDTVSAPEDLVGWGEGVVAGGHSLFLRYAGRSLGGGEAEWIGS